METMIDSIHPETVAVSADLKGTRNNTFSSRSRTRLSRRDIDAKAEEVVLHFDPKAFTRLRSPIYQVVAGLKDLQHIQFYFDQDLGFSARGRKILGRFDFYPRQIHLDRVLPYDSPRFRWTLCL